MSDPVWLVLFIDLSPVWLPFLVTYLLSDWNELPNRCKSLPSYGYRAVLLSYSSVLQLLQPKGCMSNFLFSEHFKVWWFNGRRTTKTWNIFVGTHCVRVRACGVECTTSQYLQQMGSWLWKNLTGNICTVWPFVLQLIFSWNFGSTWRVMMILIISTFNSCLIWHRYCKDFPLTEHLSPALVWVPPLCLNMPYLWVLLPTKNTPLGSSVFLKNKKS